MAAPTGARGASAELVIKAASISPRSRASRSTERDADADASERAHTTSLIADSTQTHGGTGTRRQQLEQLDEASAQRPAARPRRGDTLHASRASRRRRTNRSLEQVSTRILGLERERRVRRAPTAARLGALARFWATALANHRCAGVRVGRDQEILEYLTDLRVDGQEDITSGYRITLTFGANPFFANETLHKELRFSDDDGDVGGVDDRVEAGGRRVPTAAPAVLTAAAAAAAMAAAASARTTTSSPRRRRRRRPSCSRC